MVSRRLDNAAIADRLDAFAGLLDLAGSNVYSARAYRRAAATIRATPASVDDLVRAGRIQELSGIGAGIASRLGELVETGTIAELDELEREVRPELVGLGRYLGVAPKRMLEIAAELDVRTPDEFREAVAAGRLQTVRGVGPATERRLVERLAREPTLATRDLRLDQARELVEQIARALDGVVSGDTRRWSATPHDLVVVAAAEQPEPVLQRFAGLPAVVTVVEESERRAVGVSVEGIPVTLLVPEPARFGTELLRSTGSGGYVAALEPLPDAADEEGVFQALRVPWCPPELREEPFSGEPPPLVELADVRGDLHCHTTWSDGRATVREMALAAVELGYEYIAICDHTPSVRVVPGLDADDLRRQGEEIAAVNDELHPFRVLRGTEVDIRRDGALDLPGDVLEELDWVQLSLHAGQREPGAELTRKVTHAMRHPAVRCLSHPTGRLIGYRAPNALDLEHVIEVALETGVALEVNGLPARLDLDGAHVRTAVEAGVAVVASTDAHSTRGLGNMRLAVATARRGWATAGDVVNTRGLQALG